MRFLEQVSLTIVFYFVWQCPHWASHGYSLVYALLTYHDFLLKLVYHSRFIHTLPVLRHYYYISILIKNEIFSEHLSYRLSYKKIYFLDLINNLHGLTDIDWLYRNTRLTEQIFITNRYHYIVGFARPLPCRREDSP